MSCTNFQRTISLHKNVKYQSVILTIIEGDFQLVFENIELDTLPNNTNILKNLSLKINSSLLSILYFPFFQFIVFKAKLIILFLKTTK